MLPLNTYSFADVVVGLQYGDEGKGKVCNFLAENGDYTHFIRFGGGPNAGHTIYYEGRKLVTHSIPAGVLYDIPSIIGPGCVVNIAKLHEEIDELERLGFRVRENLYIDKRAHIITEQHLEEDAQETKIGTTKQGVGPAYRDKYARIGVRAENCPALEPFLFDIYKLHKLGLVRLLFEGAQAFCLDIDFGPDYPYVTSSHCNVGGAINNGIPPQMIRWVYGVTKAYTTYLGNRQFEKPGWEEEFARVRELGQEYGATTGRPRQIGWLDLDMLIQAAQINGVTNLIINKIDVLEALNMPLYFYHHNELMRFTTSEKFQEYLGEHLYAACPFLEHIRFSRSPETI